MTECNGCGGCCDPVVSSITPLDMAKFAPWQIDERTRRWYLEDLTPIPRKAALERLAWMSQGGKTAMGMGPDGIPVVAFSMFYECRHFDRATRTCGDYENRPQPCRDYPFEGRAGSELTHMDRAAALPPECSFRADIGQPVEIRAVNQEQ